VGVEVVADFRPRDDALDQSAAAPSGLAAALNEEELAGPLRLRQGGGVVGEPGDGPAVVEIRVRGHRDASPPGREFRFLLQRRVLPLYDRRVAQPTKPLPPVLREPPPMRTGTTGLRATLLLAGTPLLAGPTPADNWPRFRGPNGTGTAADKDVPLKWS